MLCASLFSLLPEQRAEAVLQKLASLPLPGISISLEKGEKAGISGLRYRVYVHGKEEGHEDHDRHEHEHPHEHPHEHSGIKDICALIRSCGLPLDVEGSALAVYDLLAQAEAKVHGKEVDLVHFHEVGAMDAVADIVGFCLLIHELAPERICASPVHTGFGTVKCAHGLLPVPAPATAELLQGIPCLAGDIEGELCTPTGAALVRSFVSSFGPIPSMRPEAQGYGLGSKDFPRPNILRSTLGESCEEIIELCCNIDDMSGEALGHALELLRSAGALDASWEPCGMKKGRPGFKLSVLCEAGQREQMLELIFRHTSSIGVRESLCRRYILKREKGWVESPWGSVGFKRSKGYGVERLKLEYEDLKSLSDKTGLPIEQLRLELEKLI